MGNADIDTSGEADEVKAEVLAIQAVLMSVFRAMAEERPDLAPVFCRAFDEAESMLTGLAVRFAPLRSTVGALRVIEELRTAVIRDESVCGGRSEGR